MNGPELRKRAAQNINRILYQGAYQNIIIANLSASKQFTPQEKTYIIDSITGVVTLRKRLDWIISCFSSKPSKRLERLVRIYLAIGIFDLLEQSNIPAYAVINEIVEAVKLGIGKKAAGYVNGLLRSVHRESSSISFPDLKHDPVKSLSIQYSHPEWMIERWIERFGIQDTKHLCVWNNTKHPLTIRVNTLKRNFSEFIQYLSDNNLTVDVGQNLENMFRIRSGSSLFQSEWFSNGYFSVQSQSSALAVLAMEPDPNDTIIDLCAAPGGKSTYCAELMKNSGVIVSSDTSVKRLHLLKDSVKRLGITCINIVCSDYTSFKYKGADKIIVDVPCSGLGTLHQKPDIRWKRRKSDLAELAELQYSILSGSTKLLKTGGTILYSTCTIEPEENENVIGRFLDRHPHFRLEQCSAIQKIFTSKKDMLYTLLPFKHNLDGSFIAKLREIE